MKLVNVKRSYKVKAFLMFGVLTSILLVLLEMWFGLLSGISGWIPGGFDAGLMLLAVMGILTVSVTALLTIPVAKKYG